jgi:anti-sigma factor RsiW
MDELVQKYLDGNLSDEEAAALNRALAANPELDADLRRLEKILALAASDVDRDPAAGFTDKVMERVAATRRAPARSARPVWGGARVWGLRLAWTAAFAAVFTLGFFTARQAGPQAGRIEGPVALGPASGTSENGQNAAPGLPVRLARLVYVPQHPGVNRVTVAGTFNDWNPDATSMRQEGGAWVIQLVLPAETYEYMFVEDGEQWVTDPLAMETRDDGFGRENAVLDLTM